MHHKDCSSDTHAVLCNDGESGCIQESQATNSGCSTCHLAELRARSSWDEPVLAIVQAFRDESVKYDLANSLHSLSVKPGIMPGMIPLVSHSDGSCLRRALHRCLPLALPSPSGSGASLFTLYVSLCVSSLHRLREFQATRLHQASRPAEQRRTVQNATLLATLPIAQPVAGRFLKLRAVSPFRQG